MNNSTLVQSAEAQMRDNQFWLMVPALILVLGPPIWRAGGRSLSASVSGALDGGVLLQLVAYALAAAMLAANILSDRNRWVMNLSSLRLATGYLVVCGWLLISAMWSPAPVSTAVFAMLFTVGMAVSARLASDIVRGRISLAEVYEWFNRIHLLLAILIVLTYWVNPWTVAVFSQGDVRIKGNSVGELMLCGLVLAIYGMHRFTYKQELVAPFFLLLFGIYCVYLAKLRAGYPILALIIIYYILLPMRLYGWRDRRAMMLPVAMLCVPVVLLIAEAYWPRAVAFATRGDMQSITSVSSRSLIWSWIEERLQDQFWGFGYVSGFRVEFQSLLPGEILHFRYQGLITQYIGNAHNAVYEFAFAIGWLGAALATLVFGRILLGPLIHNRSAIRRPMLIPEYHQYLMLLVVLVMMCYLQSTPVLPPGQEFGVFCFALAVGASLRRLLDKGYENAEVTV